MQILILLLFALLFYLLYPLYKERVQQIINAESIKAFFTMANKAAKYIEKNVRIYYMRSETYAIFQNIKPFELAVKGLNACKYFKFVRAIDIGKDILEIQFYILGITSEYKSCLKDLSLILEQMLNDFYMERLGVQSPRVHVILLQEEELKIWVAKNAYGNELIQERVTLDEWKDMPNLGDIEDD